MKDIDIKIAEISNTDRDIRIKIMMLNYKSKKYDSCLKTNLEEISISIPSKDYKNELHLNEITF